MEMGMVMGMLKWGIEQSRGTVARMMPELLKPLGGPRALGKGIRACLGR